MNIVGDIVKDYWGAFVGLVAALIWLVRLEGRSISNEKEIKRLWDQRREDQEQAQISRSETKQLLDEIRQDIKRLLERG